MKTTNICILTLALASSLACANPFANTSNAPFASRCDGPQGAIVVTGGAVGKTAASALGAAVRTQHADASLSHPEATFRYLQELGLHNPDAHLRLPRLAVHTSGSALVLPDLVRTSASGVGDPGNQLTFEYVNWESADQAALQSYLATAYPKARLLYGAPAFANTVKIVRDDTVTDIQGGVYDATTNEIHIPSLSGNFPEDTFVLLMLVLRAFHDDVSLFYDAWEDGFVGAAATAVQVQAGVSPGFDPKDPGPFYALSIYEAENHPGLGGSTFYPEGGFSGMLVWRIAMARAAWLKCWIEDPTFFAHFNERYYAEFTAGLQGDVPRLRELAAEALPVVEGLPFQDWFQQQYVLDTSIRAGLKEYTWNVPVVFTESSGDAVHAVVLITEHFQTDPTGSESARAGVARTIYWNNDFSVSLPTEEGNEITISDAGDTPGEGSLIPTFFNIGGPQRITVQVDLNGLRSQYIYPYGVRGFDPGENNLYGGVINQTAGTIDVTGGDGITALTIKRGVWGKRITDGDLTPMKVLATFTNPSGQSVTRQVNVGWDSYLILLDGGTQTVLNHSFLSLGSGLHFMSLPVTPITTGASALLGIAPADLLLARWDPALSTDGRYGIWPLCQPFALGRGFWLRVTTDVNVTVTGIPPSDSERVYVPLSLGWNMVGAVRQTAMPVSDLKVQIGIEPPVLLAEAITKRYVQNGIFEWDATAGYRLATQIEPYKAYWIRALPRAGARLVFEPLSAAASARVLSAAARPIVPQPDWQIPLRVDCASMHSEAAYLGGSRLATAGTDVLYDVAAPPDFDNRVTARFVRPDASGQSRWVADVRPALPAGQVWSVEIESTLPGYPVRLSWPDLSSLPAGVRPVLVDPATGVRACMRTYRTYTMTQANGPVRRQLRIEMAAAPAVAITGLTASAEFRRAAISYSLSEAATVQLTVRDALGRQVRAISTRARPAGYALASWDYRDDSGRQVAAGMYLLEARATTTDGRAARATCAVHAR